MCCWPRSKRSPSFPSAERETEQFSLADVAIYGITATGELPGATTVDLSGDTPPAGEGLYYLVRSLACGSWHTAPAAEPPRDVALL